MAPLDLFYVISHPDIVRDSSKCRWSRRHLKFSKKFSRDRHHSKHRVNTRPASSVVATDSVDQVATTDIDDGDCRLTLSDDGVKSPCSSRQEHDLATGGSTFDSMTSPISCEGSARTICGSAFSVVTASKKAPSIWRLVDDRMDQSEPEVGESTEKNAQIFSRNEDEILYSPKFFGDRRAADESSEVSNKPPESRSQKDIDCQFQPILSPVVTPAAPRSTPLTSSSSDTAPSPLSPIPVYPYFKKRLLLTTVSGTCSSRSPTTSSSDRGRRTIDPLIIGRSPSVSSFTIHEDLPTSTSSPVASSSPRLTPLMITKTTTVPANITQTAPAKIGIVISHGRAMTLQDKLQRMNSSSPVILPPSLQQQQQQPSSSTVMGTKPVTSVTVTYPEQFLGHRSSGERRRKSCHTRRKRALLKKTMVIIIVLFITIILWVKADRRRTSF